MNQPGEYAQPLLRSTDIRIPVVNGCKTARLRTVHALATGTTFADTTTNALVKNVGQNQVSLQFQESSDYTNGPFTNIGAAITVKPGGQTTTTLYPKKPYLEVLGTSGTGMVNITLNSQVRFDELAFDRNDGSFPSGLWSGNLTSWSNL